MQGTGAPKQFASLTDALAADPDSTLFEAVDLLIPSIGTLHEDVAVEAMKAGRHVLLEKPIAVSMDSAARLLAAGEELMADKVFMVAENSQYISEIVAAQKLIRDGAIGEVLTARAKYWESCSYALNPTWASSYEPGTFYCTADEGFTFDGGLHWIRPLRMFLGEVVSVVGTTGRALKHMKGASLASAIFSFDSGVDAVFESVLAPGVRANRRTPCAPRLLTAAACWWAGYQPAAVLRDPRLQGRNCARGLRGRWQPLHRGCGRRGRPQGDAAGEGRVGLRIRGQLFCLAAGSDLLCC